jgi:Holliday junction resolvase RusA-like endonuclease
MFLDMTAIVFTVIGKPQPKGAHTSFVPRYKDGSYVTRFDGRPLVVTKDSNPEQISTQQDLARAALIARTQAKESLWDGPVSVVCRYYFPRLAGHKGTGRNAGLLKDSAPRYPLTSAGDVDKLDRQVLDALSGTVITDDKLVVISVSSKHYAEGDDPPRTEVEVQQVEPRTVGEQIPVEQLALAA